MVDERFDWLEKERPLPTSVQSAISHLDRFKHLEIGRLSSVPQASTVNPARLLCPHCHQSNEGAREICWACFRPLRAVAPCPNKPTPGQDIELLLDGIRYSSTDPKLPGDIRVLMDRIREKGFSQSVLADWESWRASRRATEPAVSHSGGLAPDPNVQAFQGTRLSILRLDGVLYKSDDDNLPPDIKEILDYIEQHGVTPALMQHLRLYGTKVKFRPNTTTTPSDGDVNFWKAAKKALGGRPG